MRIRIIFVAALLFLMIARARAAGDTVNFRIYIADSTYFPTVIDTGTGPIITFADAGLNSIVANYHFLAFVRSFPYSRHQFMKNYWAVSCNSANFMTDLMSYLPSVFLDGEILDNAKFMFYPNDYGKAVGGVQGNLDLVNAPQGWDIDTGSNDILIGIYDTYADLGNADVAGQIVQTRRSTFIGGGPRNHGSAVIGCAAGASNNDTLLAGICSGCRVDFCTQNPVNGRQDALDTVMHMSADGDRIINISYGLCYDTPTLADIIAYDEMYENNTVVVAAAGNGYRWDSSCGSSTGLFYPASESHNFSVTSVGWDSTSTDYNMCYVHNMHVADSNSAFQHNARVDISAGGYNVPVLIAGSFNGGTWTENTDGTSFASPTVAGACGLVASLNHAYSAYQIKYVLKATANPIIYTMAPNFPYIGKLGTGVLDLFTALTAVKRGTYDPNSAPMQTMTIDGVELNTICAPGYSSNSAKPHLQAIVSDGQPAYTYTWYSLPGNNTRLSDSTSDDPTIDSAWGNFTADYYLVVTDASTIEQKRAHRHIHIKLDTAQIWDLASRDSYLDMLDEPNSQSTIDPREWQVWESPDVWNRVSNDASTVPQQPQYFSHTTPNYCYARIRNVGCIDAPAHEKVHLYWTKASTGENWPNTWDTSEKFNGITAGGEITDTSGIDLATSLAPGQDTIVVNEWFPPRPQDYDSTATDVEVCFLTRIDTPTITFPEVPHITTNIVNNNNIVSRNMIDYNLHGFGRYGHITFANTESFTQLFNLELATDKHFKPYLGGDISQYFSSIVVYLPKPLYNSWLAHGHKGNYHGKDDGAFSITFTPSDLMSILSIGLTPHEKEGIKIEFDLQPGVDTTNYVAKKIHVIQEMVDSEGTHLYGEVTYRFHTSSDTSNPRKANNTITSATQQISRFGVYPNPTNGTFTLATANYHDKATIIVTDILGREIKKLAFDFSISNKTTIDLSGYPTGIYTVQVLGQKGISQAIKVVKQ